nr:hypothetical protein [Tanacetum cinerariifolium]
MSINHKKCTLVIVDEYSRYTWVYFLKKKSSAAEIIMTFIEMVENQNDVKVKQIITDNGTGFRNSELESFYDEKHVNTEILKKNQNLRNELKELTSITEAWLNSSNKVNHCINEQIPTQKKKILGIDQLTEDTFSLGPKDLIFVKSSTDNVFITDSNKPRLSEAENSTLSNHDTADESSVCITHLPPLKKLDGVEPVSGPKTIKLILKLKSTFKTETLKSIILNEPSSAPTRGNKISSASKTNSAPAGPKGMYGNNSTYTTEGYGYGIVFKRGKVNVPQHEH